MAKVRLSDVLLAAFVAILLGHAVGNGDAIRDATFAYYILAVASMIRDIVWTE